ncbi:MAG: hypothetical protein ACKVZJ_12495 [Phycisphaerales bacterium]
MEQRQQQVQVGAGLQESRLNTDLINFLQKYGGYAVYLLLAIVLIYVGRNWWNQRQENARDLAFADLRAAADTGNPASLMDVANNHPNGSVAAMARVSAAGLYVDLARKGLKPGANFMSPAPEDKLDEAGKRNMEAEASKLIDAILADKSAAPTLHQQARWFKATLQADAGQVDEAVKTMEQVASTAKSMGFPDQEAKANERIVTLKRVATLKPVFSRNDLPESAREPVAVVPQPVDSGVAGITPTLNAPPGVELKKLDPEEVRKLMREGKIDPTPKETIEVRPPAAAPAPAPAPAPEGTPPAPAQTEPQTPPAEPKPG